jgi:hypothetical protein
MLFSHRLCLDVLQPGNAGVDTFIDTCHSKAHWVWHPSAGFLFNKQLPEIGCKCLLDISTIEDETTISSRNVGNKSLSEAASYSRRIETLSTPQRWPVLIISSCILNHACAHTHTHTQAHIQLQDNIKIDKRMNNVC